MYASLPEGVARQLSLDRDPHGNVQVSLIETEKLLSEMVGKKLAEWKAAGKYTGKFAAQHHFFGYEGRCAAPSNYDADYCYSMGWNWMENGIDLYSILDRVSCWCCCNKNKKELYNIYRYLPKYWERLKDLQSKIDRPMKKFCNKKHGEYGNVFDMEKVFEKMQ